MKLNTVSTKFLLLVLPFLAMSTLTTYAQNKSSSLDVDEYISNTNKQFSLGKWGAGKTILDEAMKEHTSDSDLKMLLGKYYFHYKQYDKARYELVKSLEIDAKNLDAKKILVNVELESKRYSSAICYVNELLEVSPYVKDLWQKKIELYGLQGNQVEANRLQKRLLQIYPNNKDIQNDYLYSVETEASKNRKEGKLDDALGFSTSLVKQAPDNVSYYLDVINDYLKAGDVYNALAYTDRGLIQFGNNKLLVDKKIGILEEQKRFEELLSFLNQNNLKQQYNYYLLEAARNAKQRDPFTLYLQVLDKNPGNEEAFAYVVETLLEKQQYEELLARISKYRRVKGDSKNLYMKELIVYKRMGNTAKVNELNKRLFNLYQNDEGIREGYIETMLADAKEKMMDERYADALVSWNQLNQYGDAEMQSIAQKGIYTAYVNQGDYANALLALNNLSVQTPNNKDIYLKKSELYLRQRNYHLALLAYEEVFKGLDTADKSMYFSGYEELVTRVIKDLNQEFLFRDSFYFVQRWLVQDPTNKTALKYGVNLANQLNDKEQLNAMLAKGKEAYPNEVFFKVKAAEIGKESAVDYKDSYDTLLAAVVANPYHEDVLRTLESITEKYVMQLMGERKNEEALEKIDIALTYLPTSKSLNYTKGLVLEKLKQFDKAYYYQSYYEPSLLEMNDFKQHLQDLEYKSNKNEIGVEYIRNRFDDSDRISAVSVLEYRRLEKNNTYAAKASYSGREEGKGVQMHGSWFRNWDNRFSTNVNVGVANKFFPQMLVDVSVFKDFNFLTGVELEFGGGFRKLDESNGNIADQKNMFNVVLGATKQTELFRVNAKLNNFFVNNEWLYNLSVNARYYLSSSKNYITVLGGIGSSPDVELIDYKFYDGFSVLNTNVGLGFGYMLYKNVTVGAVGTWYNYKVDNGNYRNLYNLYFNLNVAF